MTFPVPLSGGRRSVPLEQTLHTLKLALRHGPLGRVDYFHPYGLDWLHIVTAQNRTPAGREFEKGHHGVHQTAGKGGSRTEALVSCLAETVERSSAVSRERFDVDITASANKLRTHAWIHPGAIDLFSETQLREGPRSEGPKGLHRPLAFDESRSVEWGRAWSDTRQEFVYVLAQQLVFYSELKNPFATATSNGLAAGNTADEAIIQGFLELIERDATAMWWLTRAQRPALQFENSALEILREAPARLKAIGRELQFLDLTHDFGIPVVAAISHRTGSGPQKICIGSGAHFDRETAAARALTELGQWFLQEIHSENHPGSLLPPGRQALFRDLRIETADYLRPNPSAQATAPVDPPAPGEEFDFIRKIIEKKNLELIVKNLTRREHRFPVVRVIIPGLMHLWPRLGGQRLYDVPVKLGWSPRSLSETELNPVPAVF